MSVLNTITFPARRPARGTLVALHGLMESAEALKPSLLHWCAQGFDVVAVDLRGHGQSARWTKELLRRHPGDVLVEDVMRTLQAQAAQLTLPLVFFGHSAGGGIAAAVAASFKKQVAAIVLEDPFWRFPVTKFQDPTVAQAAATNLLRLQAMGEEARIQEALVQHPEWPEDEYQAWSKAMENADISLVANGDIIPSLCWPHLVETMVEGGVPILVLTGTLCCGMSPNHRAILRTLGAEVEIIRGASHFVRRDRRDQFHARVDAFLNNHISVADDAISSTITGADPSKAAAQKAF